MTDIMLKRPTRPEGCHGTRPANIAHTVVTGSRSPPPRQGVQYNGAERTATPTILTALIVCANLSLPSPSRPVRLG